MSSPLLFQLGHEVIKDHSFSPNQDILAVTKDNRVEIFQLSRSQPGKLQLVATLKGHDKTVTSVDISPDGSRILTCSQDRNALVWEYNQREGEYKPTLVLLRINRAATICRWSPLGNKFAVGSADRIIAVCYYEEENNWWVSKHLKKPLKSTITSLDWHPNNVLLACGSTDGHARVFSAYIKGLDQKPDPSVWGSKLPFQTLCGDFITETGAWIHDVGFSKDGDALAFASHDASLSVVYPQGEGLPPSAIYSSKSDSLPFTSVVFLENNKVVTGGHGYDLVVFEGGPNGWKEAYKIGQKVEASKTPARTDEDEEISSQDALNMFKQLDLKGRVSRSSGSSNHGVSEARSTVFSLRRFGEHQVSASGIDGKVLIYSI